MNNIESQDRRRMWILIVVAALGYFVDVYDLLLFSAIRTTSLTDIGVQSADSLTIGLRLLTWQNCGLLIGAVCWGVLGDKKGRLAVLFGSIITYSIANLLNAYVQTVEQYEWLRLISGIGLAGELIKCKDSGKLAEVLDRDLCRQVIVDVVSFDQSGTKLKPGPWYIGALVDHKAHVVALDELGVNLYDRRNGNRDTYCLRQSRTQVFVSQDTVVLRVSKEFGAIFPAVVAL